MSGGYLRKCATKIPHATRELAENHRRSMIKSGNWRAMTSNTYRCTQCGNYHAGRTGSRYRGKK